MESLESMAKPQAHVLLGLRSPTTATALPPRPRLPRLAGLPARPPRRACRVPGLSPPLARHARLLVLASPTWLILPVAYACLKD